MDLVTEYSCSASQPWSFETLLAVASAFPSYVATCPQRAWAILSKYDNNMEFLKWAEPPRNIAIRDYTNVQRYTSDLLDLYMQHLANLQVIYNVLADPKAYRISAAKRPIPISIKILVDERKAMKAEMTRISREIDRLCVPTNAIRRKTLIASLGIKSLMTSVNMSRRPSLLLPKCGLPGFL